MGRAYKRVQRAGTVFNIEDAFIELEELGSECRELVDNVEGTGLRETQRIQTFDETASTLEGLNAPDVPECVAEVTISYHESVPARKGRSPSRAARCQNAAAVLQAAAEAAQQWLEDTEAAPEDTDEEKRSEVEDFIQSLEEAVSEAEGCEFPGLRG